MLVIERMCVSTPPPPRQPFSAGRRGGAVMTEHGAERNCRGWSGLFEPAAAAHHFVPRRARETIDNGPCRGPHQLDAMQPRLKSRNLGVLTLVSAAPKPSRPDGL